MQAYISTNIGGEPHSNTVFASYCCFRMKNGKLSKSGFYDMRCVTSSVINKLRSSGPDHQFQISTSGFGRRYEENTKDKGERDRGGGGTVLQSLRINEKRLLLTDKHRLQRQSKVLLESNFAHLQYAICLAWSGK